jgi:hypothetical protein
MVEPKKPLTNGTMAYEFLAALEPPLSKSTLEALRVNLLEHDVSLTMLSHMGVDRLQSAFPGHTLPPLECVRVLSAIGSEPLKCLSPAPKGPNGEPVVVRPKVGFANLNNIDTVGQTVFARFFLDLYWNDPRLVGASYVPENVWRPAECYIFNQVEDMSVVVHADQPILVDAAKGLLLWPIEFCGAMINPMDLRAFPFDRDSIEIHIHQAESSSRDEFILRPHDDPDEEGQSVRFFFDVFRQVRPTAISCTPASAHCSVPHASAARDNLPHSALKPNRSAELHLQAPGPALVRRPDGAR